MSSPAPVKVLLAIHPKMDILDFTGPLEVLASASHTRITSSSSPKTPVFTQTVASLTPTVLTHQNVAVSRHVPMSEAYAQLSTFDILIIPGGGSNSVLAGNMEPIHLIKDFAELPKKRDGSVRMILSVCTGALFLAEVGVLGDGMKATTHPLFYGELERLCRGKGEVEVVKEKFVVNSVRKENCLRVVTSGGVSCGLDSCLWLIGEVAGTECKENVAEMVQYSFHEGVVNA
ncbi:uncharacterized protein RAG0_14963 [Rhynchosporium agropyri]|uniref:DJ-1/PfpI domain-containing protein n=1 Tax=Rhynchosporium agropyri TaxID=914238 RepID=A0A1E1LJ52_9HELO|nr:uncharacterized protein RAG0_14963 [Rhynchosporium agropyri]